MKIDINRIVSINELENNFSEFCSKLKSENEVYIFQDNKPTHVIMTIEHYQNLLEGASSESNEANDDSIEKLLNKIGKRIFVDYYYIFKEDNNPEEQLPSGDNGFSLNSRRSRSSSARKIFREDLEIDALENIVQSSRLDDITLTKARKILSQETSNESLVVGANLEEDEKGHNLKIGKLARTFITKFLNENVISKYELEKMETAEYSKEVFNLNFEILKLVDRQVDIDKQKRDSKGYNRYYDLILHTDGGEYFLCSQWVENLHREAFETWLVYKLLRLLTVRVNGISANKEFTVKSVLNDCWIYVPFKVRQSLGRKFISEIRKSRVANVIEVDRVVNNSQVYKKMEE
ncbi:Antitoxin Phd_YefM, type II toxin-antitoxin system [Desulfonispora thiosulfatigenes DSM 11270]|uniref:Antitoxin Phd_YefM, type II toxin-antitoxin system n=1 Tax=Desulfonispora thiosulfatigenes DSM 11270 TaxID=656914 RepID=A0A1W1UND6_DESTI|nr:type II toxin-antitoxin system Phd/YefM family antitoxin [Desulfonispora thiosulfatigenes]SMB82590.1 Antitoxin Phd_YefM, type II toxin-antitoxin system [Desulfonispora thiosulfatigenes DSM 11270]